MRAARGLVGLLAFLALLGGCDSSGEPRRGAGPPPEGEPTGPAIEPGPPRFEGIGRHLPHPTLAGWRQHGEVRYYGESDLYRIIDGAAEGYAEYGFRRLATTEYVPDATAGGSPRTVTVMLYDMGSARGAFGKWSRIAGERGDPAEIARRVVSIGGGAIRGGADLVFWKGQHLVELTYLDEDPNATEESMRSGSREVLAEMARGIAGGLPGGTDAPAELQRFPEEGLIAHSAVYYARDVLGREGLGPGWRAWYERGGKRILLARAGRAAWDALHASRGASDVSGLGDRAVVFADEVLGEVVLARKGDEVVLAADPDLPDLPKPDRAAKVELVRVALTP